MKNSVRVLHVIGGVDLRFGGPSFAIWEILRMLIGSEAECTLAIGVVNAGEEELVREFCPQVARVVSFPRERVAKFHFSAAFTRRCGTLLGQADVVHLHGIWHWIAFWTAFRAATVNAPVLLRPAGSLDHFDLQKRAWIKRVLGPFLIRRMLGARNAVHCTSSREALNLQTYRGCARRVVLPLPVDERALQSPASKAEARAQLGLPASAEIVLFMSRLNYKKGLELLIPALDRAMLHHPSLFFVLAGSGDRAMEENIGRWLQTSAIGDRTKRVGFVTGPAKAAVLRASDLFVLPSMNENFGVSVVEAMLAGLPVVLSPGVYITDDLGRSPAVRVCSRDIVALAEAIEAQLYALRQRPGLGDLAHMLARHLYSPQALCDRYVACYREMAHGNVEGN